MSLPIQAYGALIAMFGLIAISSGIWLVLRARDIANLADTPETDVVAEPARRPPASRRMTQAILAINVLSTIAALGMFVLVATRAIDSKDTRTDVHAQRP
jgi:hypothetical protein